MIRRYARWLLAWIVENAPRGDLVSCDNCGAGNEPWRTSCVNCGESM